MNFVRMRDVYLRRHIWPLCFRGYAVPSEQTRRFAMLNARKPSYRSTCQGRASYSRRSLNIKRGRLSCRDSLLRKYLFPIEFVPKIKAATIYRVRVFIVAPIKSYIDGISRFRERDVLRKGSVFLYRYCSRYAIGKYV